MVMIPWGPHSTAAVRLSARMASLLALYATVNMCALTPLSEPMLMMRP